MAATRRRIVEAAVELHATTGPAMTTISALAERAGVERLTVYRHFPDEESILRACGDHFFMTNPPPDPESWRRISDPESRLRTALAEVYAYHRRTEPLMANVYRDVTLKPVLLEIAKPYFELWTRMRDALAAPWRARGRRRDRLRAALAHALDFRTWRSLVREQGVDEQDAIELMAALARASARSQASPFQ